MRESFLRSPNRLHAGPKNKDLWSLSSFTFSHHVAVHPKKELKYGVCQDAVWVRDTVVVVCDGVGSGSHSHHAARFISEKFGEYLTSIKSEKDLKKDLILKKIEDLVFKFAVDLTIRKKSFPDPETKVELMNRYAGTTFTASLVLEDRVYMISVGDSASIFFNTKIGIILETEDSSEGPNIPGQVGAYFESLEKVDLYYPALPKESCIEKMFTSASIPLEGDNYIISFSDGFRKYFDDSGSIRLKSNEEIVAEIYRLMAKVSKDTKKLHKELMRGTDNSIDDISLVISAITRK